MNHERILSSNTFEVDKYRHTVIGNDQNTKRINAFTNFLIDTVFHYLKNPIKVQQKGFPKEMELYLYERRKRGLSL